MNLEVTYTDFSVYFYLFVMLLSFTCVDKFRICCSVALFQLITQNKCFIRATFFGCLLLSGCL